MTRHRLLLVLVAVVVAFGLFLLLRDRDDPTPGSAPPVAEPQPVPRVEPENAIERTPVADPPPRRRGPKTAGPAGPGRRRASDAPGLHGVVKEHGGGGVRGVHIELVDADGAALLSTTSADGGRFAFDQVVEQAKALTSRPSLDGLPIIRHTGLPVTTNQDIVLWVPPTGHITGTVVDANGRPVAGADVGTDKPYMPMGMLPWQVVAGPKPKPAFSAKSDAHGHFEFRFARSGPHRLRANHDGRTGSVRADSNERGVVIRLGSHLDGAVTFSGTLTDRVTGAPIAAARVWVQRVSRTQGGYSATGVASATTDELGHYEVQGIDVGTYQLGTMPKGFARLEVDERQFAAGQHVVDMALLPARKLRVRVLLPDGQPAKRALVRARDLDGGTVEVPAFMRMMQDGVRVDDQGFAELRRLPASRLTLQAVRGDLVPAGQVELDLTSAAPELVTIRMPNAVTKFARKHFFVLLDADGKPAPIDGTVVASAFDGEELLSRVEGRWRGKDFVLGNNQQYDFSRPTIAVGASAHACRIEIVAPGYQPASLTLEPGAKSPTKVRLQR